MEAIHIVIACMHKTANPWWEGVKQGVGDWRGRAPEQAQTMGEQAAAERITPEIRGSAAYREHLMRYLSGIQEQRLRNSLTDYSSPDVPPPMGRKEIIEHENNYEAFPDVRREIGGAYGQERLANRSASPAAGKVYDNLDEVTGFAPGQRAAGWLAEKTGLADPDDPLVRGAGGLGGFSLADRVAGKLTKLTNAFANKGGWRGFANKAIPGFWNPLFPAMVMANYYPRLKQGLGPEQWKADDDAAMKLYEGTLPERRQQFTANMTRGVLDGLDALPISSTVGFAGKGLLRYVPGMAKYLGKAAPVAEKTGLAAAGSKALGALGLTAESAAPMVAMNLPTGAPRDLINMARRAGNAAIDHDNGTGPASSQFVNIVPGYERRLKERMAMPIPQSFGADYSEARERAEGRVLGGRRPANEAEHIKVNRDVAGQIRGLYSQH